MREVVKGLSVEARLGNKTERANGTTTFPIQIARDDFEAAKLLKPGRRYLIGFVEIDDNEQLVRGGSSDPAPEQSASVRVADGSLRKENSPENCTTVSEATSVTSAPPSSTRAPEGRPLGSIAHLMVQNREFQMWLHETQGEPITALSANEWLKDFCEIESKSQIVPGSKAAEKFAEIRLAFRLWQNNNPGAELVAAG